MKQSNLSKRVEKAKKLVFSHNPYEPGRYQTWGSKDSEYGKKYYRVALSHKIEAVNTPDGKKNILIFLGDCQKDNGKNIVQCPDCKFNRQVCKHCIGAIYNAYKDNSNKLVSFFETYESASRMSFGNQIAKIKTANAKPIWCVIKDWPTSKPKLFGFQKDIIAFSLKKGRLSVEENINLMRGSEDDEGID